MHENVGDLLIHECEDEELEEENQAEVLNMLDSVELNSQTSQTSYLSWIIVK